MIEMTSAAQIANWAVCSRQDVQLFCLGCEEHSQLLQESREGGLVFQDQVIAARQRDEPGGLGFRGRAPAHYPMLKNPELTSGRKSAPSWREASGRPTAIFGRN